ncbi:MAG: hypothetical protein WDM90_22440 [Ferruginibacter sp.]
MENKQIENKIFAAAGICPTGAGVLPKAGHLCLSILAVYNRGIHFKQVIQQQLIPKLTATKSAKPYNCYSPFAAVGIRSNLRHRLVFDKRCIGAIQK